MGEISTSLEYESIAERALVTVFAPLEVCGICLEPLLESKKVTVCRGVVQLNRTAFRWRSGAGGHEIRGMWRVEAMNNYFNYIMATQGHVIVY